MGEVWRSLRVHLPAAYDKSVPTPLVFDVHGWTMDPISMEHASKFVGNSYDEFVYTVFYSKNIKAFWIGVGT